MIGTFWNICRACPSMPVDKLHSEYRSTYHWHEYKSAKHEVIEKPPQTNFGKHYEDIKIEKTYTKGGEMEPQLPRRKKNPAYAYRAHSFLKSPSNTSVRHTSSSLDRARCSERADHSTEITTTRRSKSEGPHTGTNPSSQYKLLRSDSDPSDFSQQLVIPNGDEKPHIDEKQPKGKISTEYRLQFAWPGTCKMEQAVSTTTPIAKKSQSMGTIKPPNNSNAISSDIQPTPVHKKEHADTDIKKEPVGSSITNPEPVMNGDVHTLLKKEDHMKVEQLGKDEYVRPIYSWNEFNSEYKKKFRPFSQYDYIEGVFKPKKEPELPPDFNPRETWFREVLELRKKAGEYKHRGWGTELVPDHIAELYNKQISLWEHVARRSSLEALSLASSAHKKSTDEDESASSRKTLPSRALWVELEGGRNEANKTRMENFLRYNFERQAPNSGRPQTGEQRSEYKSPKKSARVHPNQSKLGSSSTEKTEKTQRPRYKGTSSGGTGSTTGPDVFKHIVKSPPEPTRVKSPEQIILRSPEPVNWTVPLDTGKTFTVTQNVSEESDYIKK